MDELRNELLRFIPSKTMREYLAKSDDFSPTAEEMISLAGMCRDMSGLRDFAERAARFCEKKEETDKLVSELNFAMEILADKRGLYLFGYYDPETDEQYILDSLETARSHTEVTVFDKSEKTPVYGFAFENGEPFYCWRYSDGAPMITSPLLDRYIRLPHPFGTGDIVRECKSGELFAVVSASLPDPSVHSGFEFDSSDMSAMVVPYEYRGLCAAEYLGKRGAEPGFDDISRFHEHICVLYLELYEEKRSEKA